MEPETILAPNLLVSVFVLETSSFPSNGRRKEMREFIEQFEEMRSIRHYWSPAENGGSPELQYGKSGEKMHSCFSLRQCLNKLLQLPDKMKNIA